MMKIGTLFRKWKILSITFLGMVMMLTQLPSVLAVEDHSGDQILLELALHKISQKYDVHFNYDRNIMKDVMVDYEEDNAFSLAEALDHVFENTHFGYRIFEQRYIVVFENNDEGTESLKNMITHMQDLVEERESVRKRVLQPVVRLSTLSAKDLYQKRFVFGVSGTVVDEDGEPLIGVNIQVKGSNKGTSTDFDGHFTLEDIDENAVLVVSYVGYQTQEVSVAGKTSIEIVMTSDSQLLDEVVVVGYGTQKKVTVTGAVSVIGNKELKDRPITNSSQALQGVKGLYVNQAGGQPGRDEATIRIRGLGTIGGSGKLSPLVLIDGAEGSLSDINPNDIESISVLKDASSTAIYGSRAANGVILVTTNLGAGESLDINYSAYVGSQSPTILPDPVDNSAIFMEWYNKAQVNQGGVPYYSQELIDEFKNNPTSIVHPNTNWMNTLFGSAGIQEHNLRISGGTSRTRFNLSAGLMDQGGVLKGMSGAKRYNLNLRIQTELSQRVEIDGGILTTRWNIDQPPVSIGTAMNRIMRMVPVQPVGRMENGDWPDSWVLTPGQNSFQNPLTLKEEGYGRLDRNRILINIGGTVKLMKDLTYQPRVSVNYGDSFEKLFDPVVWLHDVRTGDRTRNPYSSVGQITQNYGDNQRLNFTHLLQYNSDLQGNHNYSALLGHSVEKYNSANSQARRTGFPNADLDELNSGSMDQFSSGTSIQDGLVSYFGRIQYDFRNRYLFEVNGRIDGSSRFAEGNQWGFFPSFSAGWRVSEEHFLINSTFVDELKLRGSWGQIGNQEIGRFQYVNAVSLGYGYPFGGAYDGGGSAITQYKDPNLKWETTTMTNIGMDWSLMKGKLSGEFDYFYKKTDDILRQVTLPAQVGALGGPVSNIATVENKGFEISANYNNTLGNDFNYQIGGHITNIKNKVLDLAGESIISGGRITTKGAPIDSWYVLETDGLFQSEDEVANYPTITDRVGPGDIKYIDRNNDGKIDGDDRYIAANTFPSYTYGFNLGFGYKSINLSTIWQGVEDIYVRPNLNMASPFNNGAGITKDWLTDSWTPENPNARLPRVSTRNQYTAENFSDSDFWLEDASYLRLKNIQLSYQLDRSFVERLNIKEVLIYANAQNYLTFTNVRHFDPERNILATNIDQYPTVKTISFGLNIIF